MESLNYQANGTLLGVVQCIIENRFVILTYWKGEYVVSVYINGSESWISGRYFTDFEKAHQFFFGVCKLNCT